MKDKYKQLTSFGKNLLGKDSLSDGLLYISSSAKDITGAERCSLFMYNKQEGELSTTLADGIEEIKLPYDMGIVGQTIQTEKPIIENHPYDNKNFLADIDMQTGYYTKNLITTPIFNSQREIIGVIELLNKDGGFKKEDMEFLSFFSHYVSGFIELMDLV